MKLRNKKTGEIIETDFELSVSVPDDERLYGNDTYTQIKGYSSIKELIEDWEDVEEPKQYWFINDLDGEPIKCELKSCGKSNFVKWSELRKQIGNYFETEEEAEKAVEKLKAWKRLKDKGFRFTDWNCPCRELEFAVDEEKFFKASGEASEETKADLDLLFGGEE